MSPMATCAWAVRCHCSLAVALDAISCAASLGNGQEAMEQQRYTAVFEQVRIPIQACALAGEQLPIFSLLTCCVVQVNACVFPITWRHRITVTPPHTRRCAPSPIGPTPTQLCCAGDDGE